MPYCPDCGVEYRAGFDTCSDCRVALQAEFPVDFRPPPRPNGWLGSGVGAFWGLLVGGALYPSLMILYDYALPRGFGFGARLDVLWCVVAGALVGGLPLGLMGGCILGWLPPFVADRARRVRIAAIIGAALGGGFGLLFAGELPPTIASPIACIAAGAAAAYLAAATFERLQRRAK